MLHLNFSQNKFCGVDLLFLSVLQNWRKENDELRILESQFKVQMKDLQASITGMKDIIIYSREAKIWEA